MCAQRNHQSLPANPVMILSRNGFVRASRVIIEAWRRHYNEVRPHSSLDYLTPNEFVSKQQDPRTAMGRALR